MKSYYVQFVKTTKDRIAQEVREETIGFTREQLLEKLIEERINSRELGATVEYIVEHHDGKLNNIREYIYDKLADLYIDVDEDGEEVNW